MNTVITLLTGAVAYGTPLLLAALGETIAERGGIINLGVEGMMLIGAVVGYVSMNSTGSPVLGAAIAATTSFVTMSAIYIAFEKKPPLGSSAVRGFAFFFGAGFMNFLSYVFAFTALSLERVSLISPLVNGSALFILPLSAVFLRGVEQLTARKIGAVCLVIIGVVLISWEKL